MVDRSYLGWEGSYPPLAFYCLDSKSVQYLARVRFVRFFGGFGFTFGFTGGAVQVLYTAAAEGDWRKTVQQYGLAEAEALARG